MRVTLFMEIYRDFRVEDSLTGADHSPTGIGDSFAGTELLMIDHRRSTEILELRTALQGQVTALQGQVTALQAHVTTLQGQQGLAGDPTQPELPEEAGGSA
nr:hypothetical protein [Tanacetum cinerariifolium]